MARIYKIELQVIAGGDSTEDEIYAKVEAAMNSFSYPTTDIYIQEVKYYGDIEEEVA